MNPLIIELFNFITKTFSYNGGYSIQELPLTKEAFEELKNFAKEHDEKERLFQNPNYILPLLEKPNQKYEKLEFHFNGYNFIIELQNSAS